MNVVRRVLLCGALALLVPGMSYAQATIAGVVKDTSGAVLPGVTVEAASPALIEKVRTVTTDGSGQYRIIDLRPGTYTVTYSLPGFNTVKREAVELSGTAVLNFNAEMRLGALEETVTVTGEAPVVDVQSVRQQQVLDREVIRDIPTSRQYYSVAALVPGMVVTNQTQDVGGSATINTPDYVIHGGRTGDGRLTIDGLSVGSARSSGANRSMYVVNVGVAQETTVTTSGGLGEAETSGVALNIVPREGGNTNRGSFFFGFANSAMQGSNFSDELRAQGLTSPNALQKVWEVTPTFGGPILKDKLWYLAGFRYQGTRNSVAGMYYNKNAGDPSKWTYEPDLTRPALDDGTWKSASIRLTYQASAKQKFNVFWDEQDRKVGWIGGGTATRSPDEYQLMFGNPNRVGQITWSSPQTNRLLLEAATGLHQLQWSGKERPGYNRDMIRVVEQAGAIPGLAYRGMVWASNWSGTYPLRASASYVTGSHTSKFGFLRTHYTTDDRAFDAQSIAYRFNNGVPNQLTLSGAPRRILEQHTTLGFFAQDSWTLRRLSVQGGLRYDRMSQTFPEQVVGFTRFIPNGFIVPESEGVNWNDITPRMSAAYDVRGDGKTAIKVFLGKYVDAQDGGGTFGVNLNPTARIPANNVTRAWADANRDYVPDCDLLNPVANGECGAYSNANFGKNVYTNFYDPDLIQGWGVRPYNWEFSAAVQREVLPRVGVQVGYFRRWFGNFVVTDNRAVSAADYDQFSVTLPADSRLPGGGGNTVTGLLDVKPAKFGLQDNYVTSANNYGSMQEYWHGVDINVNARAIRGLTISGGLSTGRNVIDQCDLAEELPELLFGAASFNVLNSALLPAAFCNRSQPFLTQVKGLASYVLPRIDVLVSATMQSNPGPQLAANYNIPNATVAAALGRNLSGNAANITANVVAPGDLYGERSNQLDLRFAKVLNVGGSRTQFGIDLYNALNANPVTTYNETLGARYLTPNQIMPARFLKFTMQIDF